MVWQFLAKCSTVTGRNTGTFPAPTQQSGNKRNNKDAMAMLSPPAPQDRSLKTGIRSCVHSANTPPSRARLYAHEQASTFPRLVMDNSTYRGRSFGGGQ